MSTSVNPRSTAYNDRRTTTTIGAKPRLPSSRAAARERPTSSGEILPEDSASNAPTKTDAPPRVNGYSRHTSERQTGRIHTQVTTRESLQVRTKSPVKSYGVSSNHTITRRPVSQEDDDLDGPATTTATTRKKEKSARLVTAPWKPQASLIPHTSAPLAPRISIPPSASFLPAPLQPTSLKQLSPTAQESAILDDLLYVLMGFQGQYIRYDDTYDPSVEKDRLAGPTFQILPGLDPSLRDLTTSVLKMATCYSAMEAFVEVHSREEFGSINHALCASIRKLLKDYLILVVQLENQLITNDSFSLHVLHLHTLPTNHMMFQVYTLAQEIIKKNAPSEEDLDDSADGLDIDNIIEQLREHDELLPGGMTKMVCKGGHVLRLLTDRLSYMSGDPAARTLLQTLLRDASRPYMTMLNEWLHHGGIKDPHAEFVIKEQNSIKREKLEEDYTDEYWEKRYTIREADVPPQLEAVKDKILLAGKYLNVVRECGGVDIITEVHDVPKSFDDPRFLDNINSAYAHANSSLLRLLLTTHALPARLQSMKHYFFLDHSDFFTYFLDLSASELKKPFHHVNVSKLQSLLDLVLRQPGSIAAQDPYKEDVKVQMNDVGLTKFLMGVVNVRGIDQDDPNDSNTTDKYRTPATAHPSTTEDIDTSMTGYESLELKFSVPFPLSLVISSKTVLRYQILFRYLLSMRHLETLLLNSWEDHNKVLSWTHRSKSGGGESRRLEMWKRRAWTLRSRMLVFVQMFTRYCTSEVIEPNWRRLMAKVDSNHNQDATVGGSSSSSSTTQPQVSRTVDELMEDHVDFLDTCLKECMLMNSRLLRIHSKLTSVCTLFATYTPRLTRDLFLASPSLVNTNPANTYLSRHHHHHHHQTHSSTSTSTAKAAANSHPNNNPSLPPNLTTYDPTKLSTMEDLMSKYEHNFNHHLRILLDALDYYAATETVALGRLCALLSPAGEKGGRARVGGVGAMGVEQ
ncbi:MAG: hypothetical protein Q9222_003505 [Ikaeria aurantiellina]